MDKWDVEDLPGLLRHTPVAPQHDHLITRIEEFFRHSGELGPPVTVEWVEHVRPDLCEAAVRPAVRESLRLLPLDPLVHVREDSVHVSPREGVVRAADDSHVHVDQRS